MNEILYEGKWEGVGPWKSRLFWHRAIRQVPFEAQKSGDFLGLSPYRLPDGFARIKGITYGPYK